MNIEKLTFQEAIKKYGKQNQIPPVEVNCPNDEFENMVRKIGVQHACEWFGTDEYFLVNTIETLCDRSGITLELSK